MITDARLTYSFGDDADLEQEIVDRIKADPTTGLGYVLEVELQNRAVVTTSLGEKLDPTVVHPLMLRSIDWDGWEMTFDLLDGETYEPTDETVVIIADNIAHIHIC